MFPQDFSDVNKYHPEKDTFLQFTQKLNSYVMSTVDVGVGPSCELWWIVKAVDSNLKFGRRRLLEKGYGNFEVQKGMNPPP